MQNVAIRLTTYSDQLKGHILVVEDDESTGTWLLRELTHKGLKASWAKTREEAQKLLAENQFHAVITDIYLGEAKEGLDIVREVEELGLPVIMISSRADLHIAKEGMNRGAYFLLEKPFEISQLFTALEKIWEEPRGLTGLMERYLELNHLTPKEKEIARLVLKGLSNLEIAGVMGNTEKTIKFHLTVIFQKCGVKSRTEFFNAIFPT